MTVERNVNKHLPELIESVKVAQQLLNQIEKSNFHIQNILKTDGEDETLDFQRIKERKDMIKLQEAIQSISNELKLIIKD